MTVQKSVRLKNYLRKEYVAIFLGLPFFFVAIFWVPLVHLNLGTERHIVRSKFIWNFVFFHLQVTDVVWTEPEGSLLRSPKIAG
jgi:hypothetical protein